MKRTIKVKNLSKHQLPEYKTNGSAGCDIRANITNDFIAECKKEGILASYGINNTNNVTLKPFQRILIPTGLYVELPLDCEVQIRPRSGLAIKQGLTVLNTPGTIDSDYRDEIGVILINLGYNDVVVNDGDRIAQMILSVFCQVEWSSTSELESTDRSGGFGSTGIS